MTHVDLSLMFARWQDRYASALARAHAAEAALAAANARADAAEARVRQLEARPAVVLVYSDAGEETVRRACTVLTEEDR